VKVRITALAPGGDAVGRECVEEAAPAPAGEPRHRAAVGAVGAVGAVALGRVTFVPLAAPGEVVRARLTRQRARVAWAELEAVLSAPSPDRVAPPCPLFGACGGCQWQHVSLAAQRASKRQIVARALGLPDVELRAPALTGSAYRERARLLVGAAGALGFRARRSHQVVDVDACLLLAPMLAALLPALRRRARDLPPGTELDLQAGREGVHLRLRLPASPGSDARQPAPSAAAWLEALRPAGLVGLSVEIEADDRPAARASSTATAGLPGVDVAEPGSPPLRIPAGGFSQVGRAANAALIEAALAALGPDPGSVLELYAGSGNFTRHLCARASSVRASDRDAPAAARGRQNAPLAEWVAPRVGGGGGGGAGPRALAAVDTVFVDPPRGGLDAAAMRSALGARHRIVYVSCDPQTLARDARTLAAGGFQLASAVALDLMPHTFHVEVVARFERTAPGLDPSRVPASG
jgi:23S rRNA (uracil1939-C5)-methyltransferase